LLRKLAFRSVHRYRYNSDFLILPFRHSRKEVTSRLTNLKNMLSIPLTAGWLKPASVLIR
jgi:hypothetical protein